MRAGYLGYGQQHVNERDQCCSAAWHDPRCRQRECRLVKTPLLHGRDEPVAPSHPRSGLPLSVASVPREAAMPIEPLGLASNPSGPPSCRHRWSRGPRIARGASSRGGRPTYGILRRPPGRQCMAVRVRGSTLPRREGHLPTSRQQARPDTTSAGVHGRSRYFPGRRGI